MKLKDVSNSRLPTSQNIQLYKLDSYKQRE